MFRSVTDRTAVTRLLRRTLATLIGCAACLAATPAFGQGTVRVEFLVEVPADTPADASVFLAGSLPQVKMWQAEGVRLESRGDRRFGIAIDLPRGAKLEYKYTRGSWESVEKSPDGTERANRTLQVTGSQTVTDTVARWASGTPAEPRQNTLTGNIRQLDDFESRILENRRPVWVYLPPGYDKDETRRYPVLYMHDGQNVFNDATSFAGEWKADETAQRLIEAGTIEPVIIVAVANTGEGRMPEYTPTFDERVANGGRADLYARFLLTEVKPFIDKTYRTLPDREHTAVAGSSLGGLVSLHIARTYPDTVGKIAAVSPSLWWDDREMLRTIESDHAWTKNCRVWFDMGTAEEAPDQSGERTKDTRVLAGMFEKFGRQRGADFQYLEVPDGQHNEAAWAARFDQILVFLFGK